MNYQPNFVEQSQPSDDSDDKNNEMASYAKKTFQGRNFGPYITQQDQSRHNNTYTIIGADQKENENSNNMGMGRKVLYDANQLNLHHFTDPAAVITAPEHALLDAGESHEVSESNSNYDRLQSTRQHISYLSKNRDHKRGFSPPIKMNTNTTGKAAALLQRAMASDRAVIA